MKLHATVATLQTVCSVVEFHAAKLFGRYFTVAADCGGFVRSVKVRAFTERQAFRLAAMQYWH